MMVVSNTIELFHTFFLIAWLAGLNVECGVTSASCDIVPTHFPLYLSQLQQPASIIIIKQHYATR